MSKILTLRCVFSLVFVVVKIFATNWVPDDSYSAAVLEHEYVESEECSSIAEGRRRASCIKLENLAVFERNAVEAAGQGADIIVFPESAIYGPWSQRERISEFAETIQEPNSGWIPCNNETLNLTAQYSFSCMAKSNRLYVVGQYVEHQLRREGVTGNYYYNTAVAYDQNGMLVAKYHKYNLFHNERFAYDRPPTPEISYFDTHFGRVGLFICFDVLFKEPAYTLVEKYQVTDIAFPTAWIDELPMWSAVGVHSAWAMTMHVNFLSSNNRFMDEGMLGSGLYSPAGPLMWTRNQTATGSILLVNRIPKVRQHYRRVVSEVIDNITVSNDWFQSYVFHDLYNFITLHSGTHQLKVCMDTFCCKLKYTANIHNSEKYAFGVFRGLHTEAQQYLHVQNCIVVKCENLTEASCGQGVDRARTVFTFFHLEGGKFDTRYIFPQVVTDRVQLTPIGEYTTYLESYAGIYSENGFVKPLLTSSLHGRIYDVTPPPGYS